jgi:hypothetical protein
MIKRLFGGVAVAAGLAMALAASPASAIPIVGTLSISGPNIIDYDGNTITFLSGATVGAASGDFATAGFSIGDVVTMRNLGFPISYAGVGPTTFNSGSDLACGAGCVFSALDVVTGNTALFNIVSYVISENPGVDLDIIGTGFAFLSAVGFDPTPGTFLFTTQGPGGPTVTFSATTISVPGPIVGAGLPGLLLACGALLILARRRRMMA